MFQDAASLHLDRQAVAPQCHGCSAVHQQFHADLHTYLSRITRLLSMHLVAETSHHLIRPALLPRGAAYMCLHGMRGWTLLESMSHIY